MVTSVEAEEKRFNTSGVLLEYFDYLKTWMLFADDFDDSGASDNGSSAHGPHGVAEYENNPGSESPGSEGSTKRHRGVSTSVATLITDVSRVLAMQDAEKAREKWVESRLLPLLEQETNTGNIRGLVLAVEADAENENFEKPIQVLTTVLSNLKCVDSNIHKVEADVSAALVNAENTLMALRNDAASTSSTVETTARARGKSPMPEPMRHLAGPSCTSSTASSHVPK